ncbi:MAG TPA: CHAT domain-containing protein [Thermoanaerobaculia bacterium]|nr:CHAT domain-containing protein [Thermoanaerobaculia bacterium]
MLVVAAIAIAMAVPLVWPLAWPQLAIARARATKVDVRVAEARGVCGAIARILPAQPRYVAAETLDELAKRAEDDDAIRLSGVAQLIVGKGDEAAAELRSIRKKTAADWNDLAAAEVLRAGKSEERWIAALVAADQAVALDPQSHEARYNRALVLDQLGITRMDPAPWRVPGRGRWAAEAKRRAEAAANAATPRQTEAVRNVPVDHLPALAKRHPHDARVYAEGPLLLEWAEAKTPADARRLLDRGRIIGAVVQRQLGESLLADTVAAIDHAGPRVARLRAGHLAYGVGRVALRDGSVDQGVLALGEAQRELAAGGSPRAAVAEEYLATAFSTQSRPPSEVLALLTPLRTWTRGRPRYRALLARIQHDTALAYARLGRWSESLAAARESAALSLSLRNHADAGAAEAIVAQDYDFLGQRHLALAHAFSSLRTACTVQHLGNAREALSVLTYTEIRAGDLRAARSFAKIEEELAAGGTAPRVEAGALVRIATIESALGNTLGADRAIARAGETAARIEDPAARTKLQVEVDSTAAVLLRKRDPGRAASLLTRAIEFEQHSARALLLPELHLERARAHVALRSWQKAQIDFDEGIRQLELQRERVDDAELRPGLFDSSAALFHEVVDLQLRTGADAATILGYIERGRARAVLEQLGEFREPPSLPEIQHALPPNSAIVEYMSLPDRLVIVVVTAKEARVRIVDVPRAQLAAADRGRLYDLLIRPIEKELRAVDAITVVPDDALQRVAFAALFDRVGRRFLVQKYVVANAPSAGVAVVTMRRAAEMRRRPSSALVFANPEIPRDRFPDLASLHTAEDEAEHVARWYADAKVFKRGDATAERFLSLAPSYEIVHYAGHASVQEAEPGASSLVCASSPRLHGALTLRQIAAMRFPKTRVVVLAACSTMTGRNAAIEGVPSLARAFVVAGVPAVVGTLRDIDDAKAAPLMRALHAELAKGVAPAEALRAAQLAAIRHGTPVEEWAAFAVTGVAR